MLYIVILVLVVLLALAIAKIGSLSNQQIENVPQYEVDPINTIKQEWFNSMYKLTWYREEDSTEGFYIQDKKTHAILGYVGEDMIVHPVKQQQEKK